MKKKQIKTKKRVADFGEVYTDIEQVKAMLDLIPEEATDIDTTYLEPAMGDGNFLEEILKRKVRKAITESDSFASLRINLFRSAASIYGVDIQEDNVLEARKRLLSFLRDELLAKHDLTIDEGLCTAIRKVLERNLICGNTLTAVANTGDPLVFCDWKIKDSGIIICKEYRYDDMLEHEGEAMQCVGMHRYSWLTSKRTAKAA